MGFFVSLHLPASLVRGEIIVVQAVVSNYLAIELRDVRVRLAKTADFKRVEVTSDGKAGVPTDITEPLELVIGSLSSQSAKSVSFALTPVTLGLVSLTVRAEATGAGDAERRLILVKAEGVEQALNVPMFVDLRGEHSAQPSKALPLDFPTSIVPGSEFCEIQVIGDILGSAFNNLNRLINKPSGCGEQNMLGLTPNIYALRYLTASYGRRISTNAKNLIKLAKSKSCSIYSITVFFF